VELNVSRYPAPQALYDKDCFHHALVIAYNNGDYYFYQTKAWRFRVGAGNGSTPGHHQFGQGAVAL
jgi:hypothetical protein